MHRPLLGGSCWAVLLGAAWVCTASSIVCAFTFSVDFQGPTAGAFPGPVGLPDSFGGIPIDEGSILTPFFPGPPGPNAPSPGPMPPPGMMIGSLAGTPAIVPGGLGIGPGVFGGLEVDALSYGRDQGEQLLFSVNEHAAGDLVAGPGPFPPNVFTEGVLGAAEGAADVFLYLGPVAPVPLPGPSPALGPGNMALVDGNGLLPFGGPGLGLIEPNPPTPAVLPDPGDNLDALDADTTFNDVMGPVFFSMDSAFPDPLEPIPANSGTAIANFDAITGAAFVGGDVVVSLPGVAFPILYAAAAVLGLDLAAGIPDSDDLDALILLDDGAISPVTGLPFFVPGADFILFSVRDGSAVIGLPDSANGAPIEPGDILTVPLAGGVSPFPAIFIPAEALGLGTLRSGTAGPFPGLGGDELDALDVVVPEPGSLALVSIGLLAWALPRRRR